MLRFNDTLRRKLFSGVATAALVAMSGSASFASSDTLPSAATDWSGFYAGASIGLGSSNFTMNDLHDSDGSVDNQPSGALAGVQAGYNWQFDTFVLGIEADASAMGWSERKAFPANSRREAEHELSALTTVRARLGIPMDNKLFYVTGGLAMSDASFLAISPGGTLNSGKHNSVGHVFGLGLEYMMPDQSKSVRVEGLYYKFNDNNTYRGSENPSGSSDFTDALVVKIGVNYQFSDQRLKRDIELISRLDNGLGIYKYRYNWSDQVYVGVMAQEVCKVVPEAVICDANGYLRVDYARLGQRLMTWQEWMDSKIFAQAA